MKKIWEKIRNAPGIVTLLMIPLFAFYFIPLLIWFKTQVFVYAIYRMFFGDQDPWIKFWPGV